MAGRQLDDDVAELIRRDETSARQHRELAIRAFDAPRRQLDVLRPERVLDVLNGEIERRQPLPVDPDAHGIAPLAEDLDVGHTLEVLDAIDDEAVDVVGDLQRRHLR